ncbi:MAG: GPI anchored serine-threonine rich family protein, partial [Candidatus Omnitrophica bacterium]|nr:GPI anchored serine-threonine rich family protein [Candidatus Omnitrophota bacterium]
MRVDKVNIDRCEKKQARRRGLFAGLLVLLGLGVGVLSLVSNIEAVQIKKVQTVYTAVSDSVTISLAGLAEAVVTSNCFILQYVEMGTVYLYSQKKGGQGGEAFGLFTTLFEEPNVLNISRIRADDINYATPANVGNAVLEFTDGVRILSGTATIGATVYARNILLPQTIDLNKSFPVSMITSGFVSKPAESEHWTFKGTFPDSNTLKLERLKLPTGDLYYPAPTVIVQWQVIEFQTDAVVKSGTVTLPANQASVAVPISDININKAFLVFNYMGDPLIVGVKQDLLTRGTITNTNTLTFTRGRAATTGPVNIAYYVVELTDPSSLVQKGSTTLAATSLTGTAPLATSVNLSRAFPIISTSVTGGTNLSLCDGWVRANLSAANTLSFSRMTSVIPTTIDWFVVELAPLTLTSPNGGEVRKVGETKNITWKHAASLESGGSCLEAGYVGHHLANITLSTNAGADGYPLTIASGVRATADSYAWTIPADIGGTDIIGEQLKVKIIDTDLTVRNYDTSNANFIIKGQITLNQPPTTWKIGETQNITWTYQGNLQNLSPNTVTITLSTDGGSSYLATAITSTASVGTGGNGSYAWTIPSDGDGTNLIGTDNLLKITLNYDPITPNTHVESSSLAFTLKGRIYNVTPTTTPTWLLGDTQTITWDKKGHFGSGILEGDVAIYYSSNSGASYSTTVIAATPAGTDAAGGSYAWTIPSNTEVSNPTSKIKVQHSTDPTVFAESGGFYLMASLDVNRPVGGEIWRYGQNQDIQWTTHGTMSNVVIKYKVGAGLWEYVTGAAPSDFLSAGVPEVQQTFSWSIPDNFGVNNVYLRVCNRDNENVYDEVGPFSLKGSIAITEPVLNAIVKVTNAAAANTKFITWNNQGTLSGTADIRLSQDGGASWPIVLTENTVDINAGSFEWTVASAHRAANCKIKVALDADEDAVTGTVGISDAFKVVSYLKLTYPNTTGLSFNVGEQVYIKWTPDPADFGTVNLRYDTNSGLGPDGLASTGDEYQGFIADGIASNNIPAAESAIGYKWTILDVVGIVGNKVRVKGFQTGKETEVYSAANYDFSIKGTITLTGGANGDGSPVWEVGTNQSITWTAVGDISSVNIYYSTTGGEPYNNTVATGIAAGSGAQTYLWQPIPSNVIANDRNTNIKFKVVYAIDNTIAGVSANPVTIQGKLIVNQPNGLETLEVDDPDDSGDSYNITWTTYGQIPQVKLYYDTHGGLGPDDIADTADEYLNTIAGGAAITNVDGYMWQVPNAIGSALRVKVVSANFPNDVYDASNGNFTIKGKIKIIAPDATATGANAWKINSAQLPSSHNISWRNCGDLGGATAVNIYYSDNGGTEYLLIIADSGANGVQTYNWTIPNTWGGRNTIGSDNKIKITQAGYESDVFAESAAFEIKGQLEIQVPNGGEIYYIGGAAIPIEWNYAGNLGNIDVYFSSTGGISWEPTPRATIAVSTAQPYNLAVPNIPTTQGKLKLQQVSDTTVSSATLDPGFAIKGSVILTYPDNEPTLVKKVGEDITITWDLTGAISNVAIDYDKASGTNNYPNVIIASTLASAKSYTWTIPANESAVSDHVRIRVRDASDGTVQDTSTADFKIKPIISISAPAGGEAWVVGSLKTISWATQGFAAGEQVKIEYSDNGGSTWPGTGTFIINSGISASALNYNWSIPDTVTLSSQCVVRLSKVGDSETYKDSNWFTLKGQLDITQPDGGVNLPINTSYTIKWSKTGNVGNVALYYSTDALHATWTAIAGAESLPAAQGATGFSWTVPDVPSATVKVRAVPITAGDPTDSNDSLNDNAIIGSIFMVHPMNGEQMIVAQPYTIEYSKFGSITNFKIDYHDGTQWYPIVANTANYPTYNWALVDDRISSTVTVRVTDANNPAVYGDSTANNIIKGSINLTAPDGAETLIVGQDFNIVWTKTGSIGNITIEYSTDNFNADIRTINASYPSGSSPYTWAPGVNDITNADTVKVRVTSIGGIPVSDTSVNTFKIVGSISNVQPSGSAIIWYKGQLKNITWNQAGNITNVDIKYKTAAGDTYSKTIILNHGGHADGANSYACTVPDENSEDCWIQVSDAANANVKSASAAAFSIRPQITVTSPAGGANITVGSNNTVIWSLNASAKVTTVDIAYSTAGAGGPFGNPIAGAVDATLLSQAWNTVSDTISS